MKLISCHDGKLLALDADGARGDVGMSGHSFRTGLESLDRLAPGGAFARGAVHELISSGGDAKPMTLAALLARCAGSSSAVIWSDPNHELYPPALAALGIPLDRLFLLHPENPTDQVWAITECLRCPGVSAVVASLPEGNARRERLTRVQARRIQLAAERGGGLGILLRSAATSRNVSTEHAAVTRWLVRPHPGERNVQRWKIQLIFGHGGRVGESVILEHRRDPITNFPTTADSPVPERFAAYPLHPPAQLADRPGLPETQSVTA